MKRSLSYLKLTHIFSQCFHQDRLWNSDHRYGPICYLARLISYPSSNTKLWSPFGYQELKVGKNKIQIFPLTNWRGWRMRHNFISRYRQGCWPVNSMSSTTTLLRQVFRFKITTDLFGGLNKHRVFTAGRRFRLTINVQGVNIDLVNNETIWWLRSSSRTPSCFMFKGDFNIVEKRMLKLFHLLDSIITPSVGSIGFKKILLSILLDYKHKQDKWARTLKASSVNGSINKLSHRRQRN